MRRTPNAADLEYIKNHPEMTPKELSKELDLSLTAIKKHWEGPKEKTKEDVKKERSARLGRSRIQLNGGAAYQLTDDIIPERQTAKPPVPEELDQKNGIYRG